MEQCTVFFECFGEHFDWLFNLEDWIVLGKVSIVLACAALLFVPTVILMSMWLADKYDTGTFKDILCFLFILVSAITMAFTGGVIGKCIVDLYLGGM